MIIYCIVYYFQKPKSTVDQVIIGMAFILVLIKKKKIQRIPTCTCLLIFPGVHKCR